MYVKELSINLIIAKLSEEHGACRDEYSYHGSGAGCVGKISALDDTVRTIKKTPRHLRGRSYADH